MAHMRDRFQKALLQGKDEKARSFMGWVGQLYDLERDYSNVYLPPNEIKRRRNGNYRNYRFHLVGVDPFTCRPFAQRRTANIDNSIVERSIRPLTIECKNKMTFGNHKRAEASTVYHTFVSPAKWAHCPSDNS